MIPLLLAACIENQLDPDKGTRAPFDPGTTTTTTEPPLGADPCDGHDNNGDGNVDEGHPDFDGDGVADCMDRACALDEALPPVVADPACADPGVDATPPADPWGWETMWHAALGPVFGTPMVGDLDGDGLPEVVAAAEAVPLSWTGPLFVLDGATGSVKWSIPDADASGGVALGDIDGDGSGDVVGYFGLGCVDHLQLRAYDATGTLLWESEEVYSCESYPAIADLDEDGTVEVVGAGVILDGPTGAVEARYAMLPEGTAPVPVDLDGDGIMEILVNQNVVDAEGHLLWSCGPEGPGTNMQPAQLDDDPEGEVLASAWRVLVACDDDGTELWQRPHAVLGSTLALGDFDGDAEQEIVFPNSPELLLLDNDGTVLASASIADATGMAGPTLWDINLDGVPEVIYADEDVFRVVDGASWTTGFADTERASMTFLDTPSVADVDGDGEGDLLYTNNTGFDGITVLRAVDRSPWTRPVYNQLSYYGDNVTDDLAIPTRVNRPWEAAGNLFRGQPSAQLYAGDHELDVAILDVCAAACDTGAVGEVMVAVWNEGVVPVPVEVGVELWAWIDGLATRVGEDTVPAGLAAGASVGRRFVVDAEALRDHLEARLVPADDRGECDPTDDTAEAFDLPCL